jgi:exosortase/archaeosortase family protein
MVVGPACAGVNFLIIAFLAVYLSRRLTGVAFPLSRLRERVGVRVSFPLSRLRERVGVRVRDEIGGLLIAAVVAYLATILTNGLRIILAAHLFQLGGTGWLTPERLHRLAGVVIYLAALVALCRGLAPGRRSLVIPLACYVGVGIGVPLLNGAARNHLFIEHALVVIGASLLVLAIAHMARAGAFWFRRVQKTPVLNRVGDESRLPPYAGALPTSSGQ